MKWIFVLTLIAVSLQLSFSKKIEKHPAKKASSAKPTKAQKPIVDEFASLPEEDVEFIKELDKQFTLHGSKIKIKVERDNQTSTKNLKRTIDGDLGYGHYSNQHDQSYHFSKPKFVIYPYSQHDIPAAHHQHHAASAATDIEITPSHGYEIKETNEGYESYNAQQYQHQNHYHQQQHQHQHQHQQQYQQQYQHEQPQQEEQVPVIVLKIPGPSKYAAHLQALLQQYLEIRAAQLVKELQEHEEQQQSYQQEAYRQQEVQYVPSIQHGHNGHKAAPNQYYEAQRVHPTQQVVYEAQPHQHQHQQHTATSYQNSDDSNQQAYAYQTYHQREKVPQRHTQVTYQPTAQEQTQTQEEEPQQYVYQKPQTNFVTPGPVHEQPEEHQVEVEEEHYHYQHYDTYPQYGQEQAQGHHQTEAEETSEDHYAIQQPKLVENYPSDKHTRVVFKHKAPQSSTQSHEEQQYMYQEVYPGQQDYYEQKSFIEMPQQYAEPAEQVVAITQKPKAPVNYHAHPTHQHRTRGATKGTKRAAPYTEEEFKKVNKLVHRLKKKNDSRNKEQQQ